MNGQDGTAGDRGHRPAAPPPYTPPQTGSSYPPPGGSPYPSPPPGGSPYPPPFPLYGPPEPPEYREERPVRTGAAMGGFLAGLVWFLLLARVSWSSWSYVWITIAGLTAASAAVAVLAWRGDRGVAAGLASVTALVGAVVTLAVWL